MKTAIIDNGLSVCHAHTHRLVVCGNDVADDKDVQALQHTHGDACADVFATISGATFDISIRLPSDSDGSLNVSDCITALSWCQEHDVSLICMSLGTNEPYDFPAFQPCMDRFRSAGVVLVASTANNGMLTAPACFDGIFGVCVSRGHHLPAGRFGYAADPPDGIHWVHSREIPGIPVEEACCSYATAAMAGTIYRHMISGVHGVSALDRRLRDSAVNTLFSYRVRQAACRDDTAYIALSPRQRDVAVQARMQLLAQQYIAAVVDCDSPSDPSGYRFSLPRGTDLIRELPLLAAMTQAQVVLACAEESANDTWFDMNFRGWEQLSADVLVHALLEAYG